jgi:hypothetical protein
VDRIECSVWNNGHTGWGLRILVGSQTLDLHFDTRRDSVSVDLDGRAFSFNTAKQSFWRKCPELIGTPIAEWARAHHLSTGTHIWLDVAEPFQKFRASL